MHSPKSNWYFKLKGLTFLIIAGSIILAQMGAIRDFDLPYIGAGLFTIWGLSYLGTSPCSQKKEMIQMMTAKANSNTSHTIQSTKKPSPKKKVSKASTAVKKSPSKKTTTTKKK